MVHVDKAYFGPRQVIACVTRQVTIDARIRCHMPSKFDVAHQVRICTETLCDMTHPESSGRCRLTPLQHSPRRQLIKSTVPSHKGQWSHRTDAQSTCAQWYKSPWPTSSQKEGEKIGGNLILY